MFVASRIKRRLPLSGEAGAPWAILIGPEGGFSDAERKRLHGMESAVSVSLGPRILRGETATIAAISIWMAQAGDWSPVSGGEE